MKKFTQRLLSVVMLLTCTWGGHLLQAAELTVCDGSATSNYIPFYGSYVDTQGCTCEFIISDATDGMSDMEGGTISKLTFYISNSPASWGSPTIKVYMGEVEGTTLSSLNGPSSSNVTIVYTGTVSNQTNPLEIELDNAYTYNGGNLLIGTYVQTASSTYKTTSFYGVSATSGSSMYYSGSSYGSNTAQSFLPKTTFTYTPGEAPATPKPTGFAVSDVLHNEAKLAWTENGTATSWQICVNNDEENLITVSENPYTLSGLTPLTAYSVKVRSVGSPNSDWSASKSFTTSAVATVVGDSWSDDFEGASLEWELINGTLTNANWAWGTAVNNGGTHAIYISNDEGNTNSYNASGYAVVFATKLLNFTTGKYTFAYDWKCIGETSYDNLRVGLIPASVQLEALNTSTNTLPAGWVALYDGSYLSAQSSWQHVEKTIQGIEAGNYYLVLRWRQDNSGSNGAPAAVDNVSVTRIACSYDVADLEVNPSTITTTGASLSWTAGEATQWQVAYSVNNNFEGANEEIVSAAAYDMTNLTPSTIYYVRVRAYCGGSDFGTWSDIINFPTKCEPFDLNSEDFSENFDALTAGNNVLPLCWSYINATTYSSYQGYPKVYNYYANSASNCLYLYSYYSSFSNYDPQPQYAILPEMSNLDGKRIKLYARGNNATSTFKIGRMTDPEKASTFVPFEIETGVYEQALTTSYQEFVYNLSGNGNYIAIMIDAATSSRSTNGVYIDDIRIEEIPSCTEPSGLQFVSATTNSATLQWTEGGSETAWDIYYSTENVAPTASTEPLASLTTNPGTIPGLAASTVYYVWVRAHCSDSDQSPWIGGISVTTECEPITITAGNPYTQGFEDYEGTTYNAPGVLPVCWDGYSTGTVDPHVIGSGSYYYKHSGDKALTFYGTGYCYAALPEFTNALNELQIDFWMQVENSSNGTLVLGYITAADDGTFNTFQVIDTYLSTAYTMASRHSYLDGVPAEAARLVFRWYYNGQYSCCIDDIVLSLAPTCRPVTGLQRDYSSITAHSVQLSWTQGLNETAWQIAFSETEEFNPEGEEATIVNVTENNAIINLPKQSTTYYAKVRANCDTDGFSDWSASSVSFTTIAGNVTPTGLAVADANITSSQATANWNAVASNTLHQSYDIYWDLATVDAVPDEPAAPNLIAGITETSQVIAGLSSETDYKVWVRDNCGTDGYSAWSSAVTFTTLANCQIPEGVSASNAQAHTADIAWTIGASSSYNLRYRTAAYTDGVNEEFATSSAPIGWTRYTGTLNNDGTASLSSSTSAWTFGSNCGVFDSHVYMNLYSTKNYWLVTPALAISDGYAFSFDLAYTKYSSGSTNEAPVVDCGTHRFAVLISTDNMEHWTILREWNNSGSAYILDNVPQTGENINGIDLSAYVGQTAYIAFFGHSETTDFDNNIHFDNVVIGKEIPAGAWQDGGSSNEKAKQLTGLAPETKYEVQVQAGCESDWDADRESAFFTTIEACFAPTLNAASNISATKATLSWAAGASEEAWQICVNGDEDNLINVTENSYVLDGLTAETEYTMKIRSNCGGEGVSVWSNQIAFTTAETCPKPTALNASEVGTISAEVEWTGSVDVVSYDVKYRTAATIANANNITEDFSNENPVAYNASGAELPENWYSYNTDAEGNAPRVSHGSIYTFIKMSDNYLLLTTNADGQSAYAIMPQYNNMESVQFKYKYESTSYGTLSVGYVTDNSGYTTYVKLQTLAPTTTITTYELSASDIATIKAANGYIAFCYVSGYSMYYSVGIDDITIITGTPVSAGDWESTTSDEASKQLSGLVPGKKYDVIVKSSCADDVAASWTDPISFTTDINTVTITNALYATHINEYPYVMPEGVIGQAFGSDRQVHQAYASGDVVAAGVPLVLHGDADTYTLLYSADAPNATPSDNLLIGVLDEANKHVADEDNYWFYVLSLDENSTLGSVGFYWYNIDGSGDFDVPVHKCYLKLPANPTSAPSYVFNENNTTSLDNLYGVDGALKFYYEGHFYILRDGIIYDAIGRKVDNLK